MERLTKSQAREVRRQEATQAKEKQKLHQKIKRAVIGTAATALILAGGYGITKVLGSASLSEAEQVHNDTSKRDRLIGAEVRRLGIQRSQTEISRWSPILAYNKTNPNDRTAAANRLSTVLNTMETSENPYFADAISYLRPLNDQGEVVLDMKVSEVNGNLVTMMGVYPVVIGDSLKWGMAGSVPEINGSGAVTLAVVVTHEVDHLKRARIVSSQFGDLPLASRFRKMEEKVLDPEERVREEARAHATEARAYIQEAGLFGVDKRAADSDLDKRAAVYLLSQDETNESWINYLKREYLIDR